MIDLIRRAAPAPPVVQLSIDQFTMDAAIETADRGLRAGVDWLELGTPLVSWAGISAFTDFTARFADHPLFLDAKAMDGSALYVHAASELQIDMVSVCAAAPDASIRAATALAKSNGVRVVGDLLGIADPISRAQQIVELGVDAVYLHFGLDELNESPDGDRTIDQLKALRPALTVPVGVVTSSTEMAEEASRVGADILLVGHPYLSADAEDQLTDYVRRVRQAATAAA